MAEVRDAPLSDLETNFGLLRVAARGDITAQRVLADRSVSMARSRPDLDPLSVLTEGLIFARMAAIQGGFGDESRVISMLALLGGLCAEAGDHELGAVFLAERIARLSLADDQGDGFMDKALEQATDRASPAIMANAKDYERALGWAKAVKLRNPLAEMPPPPAGFTLDAR